MLPGSINGRPAGPPAASPSGRRSPAGQRPRPAASRTCHHRQMTPRDPQEYRGIAEAGWRWVLGQVRQDDGPWIPESVTTGGSKEIPAIPDSRDGMHSGVGGLAHVLAEIRLARPWTTEEKSLADAIADRVRRGIPGQSDCTFFDGLVSAIGVSSALEVPGAESALARLGALAAPLRPAPGRRRTATLPPERAHQRPDPRHRGRPALGAVAAATGRGWRPPAGRPRRRGAHGRGRTAADRHQLVLRTIAVLGQSLPRDAESLALAGRYRGRPGAGPRRLARPA